LASRDFEECIRLAVSIGGDSDTIAAIAGCIAEAYYGIPDEIRQRALSYLPEEMREVIELFEQRKEKICVNQ
jgi:ADP-ribosylglycohydrolase